MKPMKAYKLACARRKHGISENLWELDSIGGHKIYHTEGSALEHTYMVYKAALEILPDNEVMQKAALLHDIGKIYTSIENGPDDWSYPDHSIAGSLKGILCKFIPLDDPYFKDYQWLIRNHIKPLFWGKTGIIVDDIPYTHKDICTLNNLRWLAVCDLMGSMPVDKEANNQLIDWLRGLEL